MKRKYTNSNGMIQIMVATTDFIITNLLLAVLPRMCGYSHNDELMHIYFIAANVAMLVSQYYFHTIIHLRKVSFTQVIVNVLKLVATQAIIMALLVHFMYSQAGHVNFIILFAAIEYFFIIISRSLEQFFIKRFRQSGRNTRRVILVGNDPAVRQLYKELVEDASTGFKVMGYYADDLLTETPEGLKYLGNLEKLNNQLNFILEKNIVEDQNSTTPDSGRCPADSADEFFVCLSHGETKEITKIMRFCDKRAKHYYYVPRMFGPYRLHLTPEVIGDIQIFTNHKEPLTKLSNRFIKRTFDIVVSSIVCICLLPIIPIVAICIKIQSPGPIFFKQKRTGINGVTFEMIKFRSMHVNKDADKEQATKNDPRKFAFGNFMRKTNIDELPQFFNVLLGDMSIVGPRPHMLLHTEMYSKLIDKYMVRHFCRPGITGYAQVTGYRGETKELWQMKERVKRDIWYIENWSILLDLYIIAKTAISIFVPDKNAY